jgi:spore coat protein CotH
MKLAKNVMLRLGHNLVPSLFRHDWVSIGTATLFAIASLTFVTETRAASKKETAKASELFAFTNVYTAHFHFTAAQWEAMQPEQQEGFFGGPGGPGGRGLRGGPGGPGRPGGPGGPGRFGPGMFLAPAFLSAGDSDRDGQITKQEFEALGDRWFGTWDKEKTGELKEDQVRDGLNSSLGGMGGGVPRMSLQGANGKRNGLAALMGVEFDYVKADLEFAGRTFTNVAVRYKGNGTWMQSQGSMKHSLKVDLNEFVKGQKIDGVSKLNFHNAVTDASWMNEVLSHKFYRDAGIPAPATAYARVYVTVPGKHNKEYLGLYSMVENIDDNFTESRFGTKKGSIFKPVTPELFADLGNTWEKYKQTYDPKDDPSPAEKQRIIDFAKLVSKGSDAEFESKVGDFLDVNEFSQYMAATVWLSTLDSILGIGQNYYMYMEPKGHKLQFFPWDLDHSFGQFFLMGSQDQRNTLSIHKPWRGQNRFLERVFKVDAFKKPYLAKIKEINETIGLPERISKQVDEIASAIRSAVKDESAEKLAKFDKAVAGESVEPAGFGGGNRGPGGGGPGGPGGPFAQGVQPIKKFVFARSKSITEQLSGKEGADLDAPPPGMPRNMGPGMFLGPAIHAKFDSDKNGKLTQAEFGEGFKKWFASWDAEKSGALNEEKLREALNQEFAPPGATPGPGGPAGAGAGPGRPPQ